MDIVLLFLVFLLTAAGFTMMLQASVTPDQARREKLSVFSLLFYLLLFVINSFMFLRWENARILFYLMIGSIFWTYPAAWIINLRKKSIAKTPLSSWQTAGGLVGICLFLLLLLVAIFIPNFLNRLLGYEIGQLLFTFEDYVFRIVLFVGVWLPGVFRCLMFMTNRNAVVDDGIVYNGAIMGWSYFQEHRWYRDGGQATFVELALHPRREGMLSSLRGVLRLKLPVEARGEIDRILLEKVGSSE